MGRSGLSIDQNFPLQKLPNYFSDAGGRGGDKGERESRGDLEGASHCASATLITCKYQEAQLYLAEMKTRILAQLPEKSRGNQLQVRLAPGVVM